MQTQYDELRKTIMNVAENAKKFRLADVLKAHPTEISRQYASRVLSEFVKKEKLIREGGGRYTTYVLPKYSHFLSNIYKKRVKNINLKEHEVFDEIQKQTPILDGMKENVQSIFTYAFLEMLNNAIEHSKTRFIDIEIFKNKGETCFTIRDHGIGVFRNVMNQRKLNNEIEAIQDILKGKVTTQPRAHTGEGIFFTSRSSDLFVLDSFDYRLRIDNNLQDVFVEEPNPVIKGTLVEFRISNKSKKHLNDVFKKYMVDSDNYAFDKTEIRIKLYTIGGIYISRSQARRVLTDLEKFKLVIMDFDKVPTIGQAFADEVFRVFKEKFPETVIQPENMNESVKFMVDRVESVQSSLLD
jgi:anti-sigma regulatory factor (Ser/Thr protein kinase)